MGDDGGPKWMTWEVVSGEQRFRGHEFKSFPASLSDVLPASPSWVPELTSYARTELEILSLANGERSVAEIAHKILGMEGATVFEEAVALVMTTLAGKTRLTSMFKGV
jgi:hypothetical protein